MKNILIYCVLAVLFLGCNKEAFTLSTNAEDFFFLEHEGAKMPVQVEGNTASGKLIIVLHGGPGGSGILLNEAFTDFFDPLEEEYGLVYYDQREAGIAQGSFEESTLNPDQFVEDLERLTALIKSKYGAETELFLLGISWGGYLGNAFLAKEENQANYKGWINMVGAHDFLQLARLGREKMLFYGSQQIALGKNIEEWQAIVDFCNDNPSIETTEDFIEINGRAYQAIGLMSDSLEVEIPSLPLSQQLGLAFTSPYDANAQVSHQINIRESDFLDRIIAEPLQAKLPNIKISTLVIGGNYDFVVPAGALQEQFDLYGSEDKTLIILPKSSHQVLSEEVTEAVLNISDFVDIH